MYLLLFLLLVVDWVASAPVHCNMGSDSVFAAQATSVVEPIKFLTNLGPSTIASPFTLHVGNTHTVVDSTHLVVRDKYAPFSADASPRGSEYSAEGTMAIPTAQPVGESVWFFALFVAVNVALIWVGFRCCRPKRLLQAKDRSGINSSTHPRRRIT
ncbi:hypothetical protein FB45DRAFT_999634, partial [Roridomyces roridus]